MASVSDKFTKALASIEKLPRYFPVKKLIAF